MTSLGLRHTGRAGGAPEELTFSLSVVRMGIQRFNGPVHTQKNNYPFHGKCVYGAELFRVIQTEEV